MRGLAEIHGLLGAMVLVAALLPAASFGGDTDSVRLTEDGKATVRLVLDSDPDGLNRVVADDFVNVVERISGARIPEGGSDGLIPVYL
jgi:hypothetical protein